MKREKIKIVVRRIAVDGANAEYYALEQLANAVSIETFAAKQYHVGEVLPKSAVEFFCNHPLRYAVTVFPPTNK